MAAPKATTEAKKPAPAKKPAAPKKAAAPKAKAAADKASVKKVAAPKKPAAAKKPAAKKAAAPKKANSKPNKISPEERYRMVEVAAYFMAERNGFAGSPVGYWTAAEAQISKLLGK